jgi:AraC-like DNA-binding protein
MESVMQKLRVKRHAPLHPMLRGLIKFYWVMQTSEPVRLNHKLLPVSNTDAVFNFSSAISYESGGTVTQVPNHSLSGLRTRHLINRQSGRLLLLGVSFRTAGLYPFIKVPVAELMNCTVALDELIPNFKGAFDGCIHPQNHITHCIEAIEEILAQRLEARYMVPARAQGLISAFARPTQSAGIKKFCSRQGISQRRLERIFNRYVGLSPKRFKRLTRFQAALNSLLKRNMPDFGALAYEHDYYDQAHFIHDFKAFTGCSPRRFVKQKASLKQIMAL